MSKETLSEIPLLEQEGQKDFWFNLSSLRLGPLQINYDFQLIRPLPSLVAPKVKIAFPDRQYGNYLGIVMVNLSSVFEEDDLLPRMSIRFISGKG